MGEKIWLLSHICLISDADFTQNEVKMGEKTGLFSHIYLISDYDFTQNEVKMGEIGLFSHICLISDADFTQEVKMGEKQNLFPKFAGFLMLTSPKMRRKLVK